MDSLEDFIDKTCGDRHFRIEQDLGEGFVRLKSVEAERRQAAQDIRSSEDIVLELLRNSLDAGASHIFLATGKEASERRIVVIDDGEGIPASMQNVIFEARVTSKLNSAHEDRWGFHGRGMALFSVAERTEIAEVVRSEPGCGTAIAVEIDGAKLPEKTDQSTFPHLVAEDDDHWALRGPKNILRIACEFSLEYLSRCLIYVGSPAEIAATAYRIGIAQSTARERAHRVDLDGMTLWRRLSHATDAAELAHLCAEVGLALSERTARRIINDELSPLQPLIDLLGASMTVPVAAARRKASDGRRRLRLGGDDREELQNAATTLIESLGERYYFRVLDKARIKTRPDAITITVPIDFDEEPPRLWEDGE